MTLPRFYLPLSRLYCHELWLEFMKFTLWRKGRRDCAELFSEFRIFSDGAWILHCHIYELQKDNFSSSSPNSPLCLFWATFYIPTNSSSHIENKTSLIFSVTAIHNWLLSKKGLLLWFPWIFNLLYYFIHRDPRVG